MPGRKQRDAPAHRRHRRTELDAHQTAELERYVAAFAADWDAREERFPRTFALMVAEGVMSSEERETRLAEIHETRLEHERDHREGMIDALQMTDEEWDEIKSSSEFQENMRQLQAMAEGFAEALKSIEFTADPDDPAANLLKRNLFGSVERLTGSLEDAARAADIPKLEPDGSA